MKSPYLFLFYFVVVAFIVSCQHHSPKPETSTQISAQNFLLIESIANITLPLVPTIDTLLFLGKKLDVIRKSRMTEQQDSILALAYDKIGGNLLRTKNRAAKDFFLTALSIRKQLWKTSGHADILRMYHNIGLTYSNDRDFHRAIVYFDSASKNAAILKPILLFHNAYRKAQAYYSLGEHSNAGAFFRITEDEMKKSSINFGFKSDFYGSYASNFRQLALYGKGIELVKKGLKEFDNTDVSSSAPLADLYVFIGNLWVDSMQACRPGSILKKEALNEAITYLNKALSKYKKIENPGIRVARIGLAIGNLGELLRRSGQLIEAEHLLDEGLDTLLGNPLDSVVLALLYINRGETFFDQKKFKQALIDYDQAMAYLVPAYQPAKGHTLPALHRTIRDRSDFQFLLGDIALANLSLWEQQSNKDPKLLQRAATVYDTLFKLINITRGDFISDDEKLNLAQKSQLTLRKAAWCSAKLAELFPKRKDYYWQQAFQIAEQSKAFALIEAARLKNVSNNLDPAFRAEEQDLLEQYSQIENELLSARNDPKRLAVLTVDKSEVVDKIRIHQQRLKQQYPNYYALKYRGADLSVDKIQKQVLGADQALVAYYFQDSALSIFVVTPNTFLLKSVSIREDSLQSLVNTYLELLSSNRSNKEAAIAKYGSQLYSILLQPVASMLPERLILVPAGPLNNLPFEALLMRPQVAPFKEQLRAKNFVLSRYAVSYCFSANLLFEMQQAQLPQQVRSIPAIMAANFQQFQAGKASTQTNLSSFLRQSASYLTPLGVPQKQEVDGIVKVIPQAQKYLKLSATKQDFFAASKNSSIIHAPTHGILNPTDPSQSFIAFSQHGDSLRRSELLFVNELYSRFLNVDLIFLSACQTATGKFIAGEGNISLGRGLAYAGVRSFISTLWNVPVAPKASIAADFYQSFLLQHQPKDVALAQAKRLAAEQYPDPNDWAGFVLQGACLPAAAKTNYWSIAGVGLTLLFLLIFGFRMIAKRRRTLARA